ncbi:hypothetical protein SAMN05216553_108434 [Lentzea fradiae]|uniref:Uncharacterized protein n=2 Tax=Lentzea fradiae TaxID=200378 RepID=A0A1G7UVE0_9PSEU|nr:hypothetical protein SAMN05216553_108434 [Lentzea fradiae]
MPILVEDSVEKILSSYHKAFDLAARSNLPKGRFALFALQCGDAADNEG